MMRIKKARSSAGTSGRARLEKICDSSLHDNNTQGASLASLKSILGEVIA